MRMRWDRSDRLVQLTDRDGRITRYEYHPDPARDVMVARVLPDGSVERRDYDDLDRLVAETNPAGAVTRYGYEGEGRWPTTVTDPMGAVTRFDRDDRGLLLRSVDPDGVTTRFEWRPDGQVAAMVDGAGGRTEATYDNAGTLIAVTDPAGVRIVFATDDQGRVVRTVDRYGIERRYGWTAAGRPRSCTSDGAENWEVTWGEHGDATAVTDQAGASLLIGYDVLGLQDAITLPDGRRLGFEYDQVGTLVAITDDSGARTTRACDGAGHLVAVTDADGLTTSRTVDHHGRTRSHTTPDGHTTVYTHRADGVLASMTGPDGAMHRFEADPAERVTAHTGPDGATTTYTWSPGGRLLTRRSPSGRTWTFAYDPAGRPEAMTGPDGRTRTLQRAPNGTATRLDTGDGSIALDLDPHGRLTGWTVTPGSVATGGTGAASGTGTTGRARPGAETTGGTGPGAGTGGGFGESGTVAWDAGRVSITPADTGPTVFELDRRGAVARATDPTGAVTAYARDLAGRITTATTGPHTLSLGYDDQGHLASITDALGATTSCARTPAGRLRSVDDGEHHLVIDATPGNRVEAVRTAGGDDLVVFDRDACGRVTRATTPAGTVSVAYDGYGSITATTHLSGTTTYRRDPDGLVTAAIPADGPIIGYERDAAGSIAALTVDGERVATPAGFREGARFDAGRMVADRHGRTHRYDHAGRLVESVGTDGRTRTFRYNRLSLLAWEDTPELGRRRLGYNRAGQLTSITLDTGPTTTIGYDTAGRRVAEKSSDGSEVRYTWNPLSQLTAITRMTPDGAGTTTRITYSGLGRPELVDSTVIGWDDAITGKPVQIGDRHHLRSGLATHPINTPGRGNGIPDTGHPIDTPDTTGRGDGTPDTTGWDDGTRDDPWGHDGAAGPRLGYRGELAVGSLVFLGARVYDTATRQFLTPDPAPVQAGQPGSHNRYAYTWCDPVNQLDPTGLQPVMLADFADWRDEQERSRWGSFTHAIAEDPWGAVALAGVILVGAALVVFTGGVALAIGAGLLLGAGIASGYGFATKNFDPTAAAATGIASGLAAGLTVFLGPGAGATGWTAIMGWAGAGAAGGAGTSLTNQVIADDWNWDNFDTTRFLEDTTTGAFTGAVSGGVGRYLSTGLAPGVGTGITNQTRNLAISYGDELFSGTLEWGVEGALTGNYSPNSLAVSLATELAGSRVLPGGGYETSRAPSVGPPLDGPELLTSLRGMQHTPASSEVVRAIDDGSLTVRFDPDLPGGGTVGAHDVVVVNNAMHQQDVLTTIVHEGQHAIDLRDGVIAPPDHATLTDRAYAEMRGFAAETDFATLNNLTESQAYQRRNLGAMELGISIADSYPALSTISDQELMDAVRRFTAP